MTVEILQHQMSGELYAASYKDGMTLETLNGLAGPLTIAEAYEAVTNGMDTSEGGVEWARTQPWSALSLSQVEARAGY